MNKVMMKKKEPKIVSDRVKEAHQTLVMATTTDALLEIGTLIPQIKSAAECRDYKLLRDLANKLDDHNTEILKIAMNTGKALGVTMYDRKYDDDDDVECEG